jgi:transposase
MDAIAEQLQISRTAVNETLHRFKERGISAKDDEKRSGRPRKLNQKQLKSLKKN